MEVFKQEISFISQVFVPGEDGNGGEWKEEQVKKVATFKELSRTDKLQHKLHFALIGIMTNSPKKEDGAEGETEINPDALYDLTVKAIKTLLLIDEDFKAVDKTEFLADSGAIFKFALWFLGEKITPFFSQLMTN